MKLHYDFTAHFFVVTKGPTYANPLREYDCTFAWPDGTESEFIPDGIPDENLVDVLICEALLYATDCLE